MRVLISAAILYAFIVVCTLLVFRAGAIADEEERELHRRRRSDVDKAHRGWTGPDR